MRGSTRELHRRAQDSRSELHEIVVHSKRQWPGRSKKITPRWRVPPRLVFFVGAAHSMAGAAFCTRPSVMAIDARRRSWQILVLVLVAHNPRAAGFANISRYGGSGIGLPGMVEAHDSLEAGGLFRAAFQGRRDGGGERPHK